MPPTKDAPTPDSGHPAMAPEPPRNGAQPVPKPSATDQQPIKPMHHLPRGKNTWNPKIIRQWWFWPAGAAALYVLYYVYPVIWDWFAR